MLFDYYFDFTLPIIIYLFFFSYGIVVHGAVDGHSKAVVFLKCSTNNRAKTVLNGFLEAVTKWGLFVKMRWIPLKLMKNLKFSIYTYISLFFKI